MSNESLKVSYRWIWLPISFGLALCVIVLSLYFFEFGKFGLSKDPTEWASFGSLLAGIFTFLSATGTIGTLIFMIRQHQQLTLSQAEISKKQMEILEFEKYEKHKSSFYESLDIIIHPFRKNFTFYSKAAIYRQFFPENTPETTKYNSPKKEEFKYLISGFNEILESINDNDITHSQVNFILELIEYSKVTPLREGNRYIAGDIYITNRPPLLNIFNMIDTVGFLRGYLSEIAQRCRFDAVVEMPIFEKIYLPKIYEKVYNAIESDNSKFPQKIELSQEISKTLKIYKILKNHPGSRHSGTFKTLKNRIFQLGSQGDVCNRRLIDSIGEALIEIETDLAFFDMDSSLYRHDVKNHEDFEKLKKILENTDE